jgi:hypothetical protein
MVEWGGSGDGDGSGGGKGERTLRSMKEEEKGDPNTPMPHPPALSELRRPLTCGLREPGPRETDFVFISPEPGSASQFACWQPGTAAYPANQTLRGACLHARFKLGQIFPTNHALSEAPFQLSLSLRTPLNVFCRASPTEHRCV